MSLTPDKPGGGYRPNDDGGSCSPLRWRLYSVEV